MFFPIGVMSIGSYMLSCKAKGWEMPKIVILEEEDGMIESMIKGIIRRMTVFDSRDRPPMATVLKELEELFGTTSDFHCLKNTINIDEKFHEHVYYPYYQT